MNTSDIDLIILGVRGALPEVTVRQLQVTHPGDDDGLWFVGLPGVNKDIQLESSTGNCPFVVETDEQSSYQARVVQTVEEVVRIVVDYLTTLRSR